MSYLLNVSLQCISLQKKCPELKSESCFWQIQTCDRCMTVTALRVNVKNGWIYRDHFYYFSWGWERTEAKQDLCAITAWFRVLLLFDHYRLPSVFLHISDSRSVRSHLFGKLLSSFLRLQVLCSFSPAATCATCKYIMQKKTKKKQCNVKTYIVVAHSPFA